ncbi:MAG TPA: DUF4012 domain-containing protein, partial [Patescibacteria group bacterium]|nr:DUF4012 domain-containing protein [Patescibacteria group bacterium]
MRKLFHPSILFFVLSGTILVIVYAGFSYYNLLNRVSVVSANLYALADQGLDSDARSQLESISRQLATVEDLQVAFRQRTLGAVLLSGKFRAVEHITAALKEITLAGNDILATNEKFKGTSVGLGGLASDSTSKLPHELSRLGERCKLHFENAEDELVSVDPSSFSGNVGERLAALKTLATQMKTLCSTLTESKDLLNLLLTGHRTVLLVLQNNNEIRATGGFFGTYGHIKLDSGKVSTLKISSIYDLDGQLKAQITPFIPIQSVNNRLYLRDSNFFAEFPKSAELLASMYEKEGGETPDLIVAANSRVLGKLLTVTGPIAMPTYGVTVDSKNYSETIERLTSVEYNILSNTPKQFLADLAVVLVDTLKVSPARLPELLAQSLYAIGEKDLMFYSRFSKVQELFERFGVAGRLPQSGNFIHINMSNFSGSKSDNSVQNSLKADYTLKKEGRYVLALRIRRENTVPATIQAPANLSFIRVYVPVGAVLKEANGFDQPPVLQKGVESRQTPEVIQSWNESYISSSIKGVFQGSEFGRPFFAYW